MHRSKYFLSFAALVLVLATLACSTSGGGGGNTGGAAPIRQWASSAVASSEYGSSSWNAGQATGAPNTTECADEVTAWASSSYTGYDWLEVSFTTPVIPTQINIHESYTPGQIIKVEVRDTGGNYQIVWQGPGGPISACPHTFIVDVSNVTVKVSAVRITVDQSILGNWNEIDAVELVGTP